MRTVTALNQRVTEIARVIGFSPFPGRGREVQGAERIKPHDTGFFISAVSVRARQLKGQCRGRTHVPMRLLTSQRANLLAVSQEQSRRGDGSLASLKGALEIEASPSWSGSLSQVQKVAEVGGITRLACPMV